MKDSVSAIEVDQLVIAPMYSNKLADYFSVMKFGITMSNLFAVFTGICVASIYTGVGLDIVLVLATLFGSALVISASCALNNFIDRDIDPLMKRTSKRAMADKRLDPQNVLALSIILVLLGLIILLSIHWLPALCAGIGFVVYVGVYTLWLKRRSSVCTIVGSIAGAMPPVLGWVAVTHQMDVGAWLLFLFMFLWQPPHFWALAILKKEDYAKAQIPMLPVVKGIQATKLMMLPYLAALLPVTLLFTLHGIAGSFFYWIALFLSIGWLTLAIAGFFVKDDLIWAKRMFLASLVHMTVLFIVLIIDTVPAI